MADWNGILNFDMNDPKTAGLLNIGLGILAGNTGRPGDLGQGLLGGMQNYQQMMAQQQRQKMLDQQFKQEQELFQLKKAEYERDAKKPIVVGKSLLDPNTYKPLYEATGAAGGADPYFSPIATENGLAWFDHRTGKLQLINNESGAPVVKSSDSPAVRGAVKGAESEAAANWKPNTDIDGTITTDANVARMVNGLPTNNFSTPYPVTFGAPGTTATDVREGTTGEIPLRNPGNPRPGIRVPTKAEQAAAETEAKIKAEDRAKTSTGLGQAVAQAEETLRLVDELVGSADGSVPRHPGFEAAVGMSSKFDPRNYLAGTEATAFNTRLDQLKGKQFLQAYESLKGSGQITEIEGKKATDAIARMNTATTEEEFVTASRDFQKTIRGAVERAKAKVGGQPSNNPVMPEVKALQLPAKPSSMTLKKGTVYQTPRGNLRWNGKAFEDL
jgi:hypothetical protein